MINYTMKSFRSKIAHIAALTAAIFVISCSCPKQLPSTSIHYVYKDSIIVRTELVSYPLPQESHSIITKESKSHLETSLAVSDAEVDSTGLLHHTIANKKDSIKWKIQYVDRIVYRDSIVTQQVPVEVEVPVKYVPAIYKWSLGICITAIILLAAYIFLKFKFGFFKK